MSEELRRAIQEISDTSTFDEARSCWLVPEETMTRLYFQAYKELELQLLGQEDTP